MRGRLAALLALALLMTSPGPALAQDVPVAAEKDLWCGIAFAIIAAQAPGDATDEQRDLAQTYAQGGSTLTDRARSVYLESGYSPERLDQLVETLRADIDGQVNTVGKPPRYSYEECRILLPF